MDMEDAKARLEALVWFLESMVNDYDFTEDDRERAAAKAEGREPTLWYCDSCGADYAAYDEARWQLEETRKVLKVLG